MKLLTASRLRVARSCRREHRIRYDLMIRPAVVEEPLRFGSVIHSMLEAWWAMPAQWRLASALAAIPANTDPFERVKLEEMLRGYDARWRLDADWYEVLGVEVPFETEFRNPETGRISKVWRLAGKVDAILRDKRDGRVLVVEHKTAAGDISPGSEYWRRLRMDAQVSIYLEGAKSLGHDPVGVLYDVLGRPAIRPLQKTKTRAAPETPEEYRARLIADMNEAPGLYFQRGDVVRLEAEMNEALCDIWQLGQELHEAELAGRAPRNPDACIRFGRTCPFWEVCTGGASLDDTSRFIHIDTPHPELSVERPKERAAT